MLQCRATHTFPLTYSQRTPFFFFTTLFQGNERERWAIEVFHEVFLKWTYSSMVFACLHFSIIHSTINKTIYWTCLSNACILGSCFPNTVGRNDDSCYFVEMFLLVGHGHQTLHTPSHLALTTTLQGRCLFVWPNIPQWQVGGDSWGSGKLKDNVRFCKSAGISGLAISSHHIPHALVCQEIADSHHVFRYVENVR